MEPLAEFHRSSGIINMFMFMVTLFIHARATYQLVSTWTKWPPFRRQYFQLHFVNEKFYILITISLKFVPKGAINNNSPVLM